MYWTREISEHATVATVRRCVRFTRFLQINRGCLIIMNPEISRFGRKRCQHCEIDSRDPSPFGDWGVLWMFFFCLEFYGGQRRPLTVSSSGETPKRHCILVMCKMPGSAKRVTRLTIINRRYPYFKWVIPSDHAVVRSSRLIISFTTSLISAQAHAFVHVYWTYWKSWSLICIYD